MKSLERQIEELEVTLISSTAWAEDNRFKRLDSEHQLRPYRNAIKQVQSFGATQFSDDTPTIIHPQEIKRNYTDGEGVWFLRAQNVRPQKIETNNQVFISHEDAEKLSANTVKSGDVLITRTGANRGQCAYYSRKENAIASSHTFIVRPNKIDAQFLSVFLNTRFGRLQIDKGEYGAAQPELAPYYIRNIWIPNLDIDLVAKIKSCIKMSNELLAQSEEVQNEANAVLLNTLQLDEWTPPEPLTYIANSKSVTAAQRIDADYFHPQYGEIEEAIEAYEGGFSTIGDEFIQNTSRLKKNENEHYRYVEIGSVDVSTGLIHPSDLLASELPENAKTVLNVGDVIVSKVRTYRGGIGIVSEEGLVGSGAFTTLTQAGRIEREVLCAFLRLKPLLHLSLKPNTGTSYPVIHDRDILTLSVPLFHPNIQKKVCQLVNKASDARIKSQTLLEGARHAVEIAIEKGEKEAFAFLEHHSGVSK